MDEDNEDDSSEVCVPYADACILSDTVQYLIHKLPIFIGGNNAAGTAVDIREVLASLAYDGCIDDRQHLDEMLTQQSIEECFIVVLHCTQVDVLVDWFIEALVLHVGSFYLFLDILVAWRQESDQVKVEAFPPRESRALIQ